jgi:hypothetical protein
MGSRLCESKRGLSAAKFPVLVNFLMCDACLALGQPWLPALHGGQPRPRTTARTVIRLRKKRPAAPKKK